MVTEIVVSIRSDSSRVGQGSEKVVGLRNIEKRLENEFSCTGKSWCALTLPSSRTGVASTKVTYCFASLTTKVNFRSGTPDAGDAGRDMMQRGRMEENRTGAQ